MSPDISSAGTAGEGRLWPTEQKGVGGGYIHSWPHPEEILVNQPASKAGLPTGGDDGYWRHLPFALLDHSFLHTPSGQNGYTILYLILMVHWASLFLVCWTNLVLGRHFHPFLESWTYLFQGCRLSCAWNHLLLLWWTHLSLSVLNSHIFSVVLN